MSVILILTTSCSTRKNNFPNRAYHTVTSTYNVNYNGREALNKGISDLDKKRKDNFLELLPIYFYPPKQDITSSFPSFDRAIEKASKSVFKHSIMIRGKEYVKPMSTAYMIMGKAYFYKQDYNEAKRVFNYILNVYKDWGSVEEATIWIARAEMRQDYYVRAQSQLEEVGPLLWQSKIKSSTIRNDDELKTKSQSQSKSKSAIKKKKKKTTYQAKKPSSSSKNKKKTEQRKITNNIRLQYYAAQAEYHLNAPNGEIEDAIDNIKITLQYRPKKDFRVRLFFILGQLYEKLEERQAAQNWFLKVIRATPEYDMEFNARLRLAVNYDGTPLSKKTIMKELNKMLKESKNEDYRDQIYYAFSEIARIDEDNADREFYLAKSVAAYINNDYQRTYSSIALADIYFEEEEYMKAQTYYDTALVSLPSNYPNSENIIIKATILRDLVDNLRMIQLQDSLQRIAKMSESERTRWVNKMIADYTEEERRLAKEEADRMLALNATQNFANINVNTQGQSNKWYFYNPGLVTQGATDFFRRFGNRKLEDNWRISNRTVISFEDMALMNDGGTLEEEEEEEFDEEGNPIIKRETDPKKSAYYTQDLPLTPETIEISNNLIVNAMYNAAIIYFDQLSDLKRSNEMLLKLIQLFPNHELELPAYFLLWTNYTKLKNNSKMEETKNIILTKYPNTDYAKLILDPDYYKKMQETANENVRKYEELHRYYNLKQWHTTVQLADDLLKNTDDVSLIAKASYLRAIAIWQTQGEDSLKISLSQIIKDFPREPVTELAKILLSTFSDAFLILDEIKEMTDGSNPIFETIDSPFNTDLNEQHYIIILVDVHKKTVTDVKYDVSTFNSTYFSLERFNINSFYVNQNEQLVTIARFKNKTEAMNYYIAITTNNVFTPSIQDKGVTIYAISASNYSIYYNRPDDRYLYRKFFEENYQ